MLKVALSFICGAAICSLIVIGVKPVLPVMADTTESSAVSDNGTSFLAGLVPDIDKIYRESLTAPFIRAESKIYDEDIAAFYGGLMDKTGLTDPNRK
jgi:hypothetical protein